ncbi:uncharacterized protein LOC111597344 [Drosophila hydei]|uniref:Uncharacterized protein LOC111597344 n=1 Tax=Drosophila hydei TaxID=7224 RepID=A0A6J1LRT3_DROHY|nr:uncharacterized protein LOC111597344 [Drosophila hydei]
MESANGVQYTKDKDRKGRRRVNDVHQLSRMPGHCPVSKCSDIIFPSNIMMHMLHKHTNSAKCTTSEIFDHRPLLLCFDPTGLEYGDNCCVACLMYGGMKGKMYTRPAVDNLSLPNSGLLNSYHKYDDYLPVMMMVCRSSWFAQMKDKQVEREMVLTNEGKADIYVLWLVAPVTTRKVYYTLTVYDRHYISSRSSIRTVRDYTSFQNPSDFLPNDENYILLRQSEVLELMCISKTVLSKSGKKLPPGIPMELIIYQAPLKPSGIRSSETELHEALKEAQKIYSKYIMPRTKGPVKRKVSGKLSLTRRPCSKTRGLFQHTSN